MKGMTDYKITTLSRTSSNVNNPINGQNLPTMMIRSSTAMTLDEQPMFTEDDITETESEIFSSYLENIDSHVNTWIEQCQIDVQTTEDLAYKDTKIHILNELNTIRKTLKFSSSLYMLVKLKRRGRGTGFLDTEARLEHLCHQLYDLKPLDEDKRGWLKSKLVDIANQYHKSPMEK
ncbi:unnamed protein product [Trichobilharzia regenti]|nr:unnamed protein product [Trichobilharzia regenti]